MRYEKSKHILSTRQAQWKKQWIAIFVGAGIERHEAEIAFSAYYGLQEVNIFLDPIDEANGLTGFIEKIEASP